MLFTLATVREQLWKYANQTVAYASATAAQKEEVDFRINQVCERFFYSGKWKYMLRRIVIPIYDGYVTLPRELGSIVGIKLIRDSGCCCVSQIYTKFHEFAHSYTGCCSTGTYPISETAQSFITPDAGFKLRIKSTITSGTIYFRGGWSTSDVEYFDSVSLAITNGTVTTTREWNTMPRIQKDVTTVGVDLYSVDSDGNEELIANYAPYEEVPAYRKYKVPDCDDFNSCLVLGKLTYVPAIEDHDIVIPSNWGALKAGLKALQSEDTEEDEMSDKDWERAYSRLNGEVGETDQDNEMPVFKVAPEFGAGSIINVV